MKSNLKRFLSLALALVMVVGLLPMNVLADEAEDNTGAVTLDIANGSITITATGYTQNGPETAYTGSYILTGTTTQGYNNITINGVAEGATITLKDLSVTSNGPASLIINCDADIVAEGSVDLTSTSSSPAINAREFELTVTATGAITVEGGIFADSATLVADGDIKVSGAYCPAFSGKALTAEAGGNLTLNSAFGVVYASETLCLKADDSVTITTNGRYSGDPMLSGGTTLEATLEAGGDITLTSSGDFAAFSGKALTAIAGGNLNVQAGSVSPAVTVSAQEDITLNAQGDVSISCRSGAVIQAGGNLTLQGQTATVKRNINLVTPVIDVAGTYTGVPVKVISGTVESTYPETPAVTGTITGGMVNVEDPDNHFISTEIQNLNATESVVVKLYSGETHIATTTLQKSEYFTASALSVKIIITGESSSWKTVWEDGKLSADYVPDKVVLYVDGTEMNSAEVKMIKTSGETAINWADVVPAAEVTYVAQIGETKYETLQEALNACTNGETVKLITDITYDADDVVYAHGGATGFGKYDAYNPSIIYVGGTKGATDAQNQPSNVNAVLDLNGHTIANNADACLFLIMDNAKLTFKDSVGNGAVINQSENYPAIWACGTETLVTIESGTYETTSPYGLIHSTHAGDVVITGGHFSTTADDASLLLMLNTKPYNNPNYFLEGVATMTVKGGTFVGFNPEKVGDDYGASSIEDIKFVNGCADGYVAIDNGNGTWTVKELILATLTFEGWGGTVEVNYPSDQAETLQGLVDYYLVINSLTGADDTPVITLYGDVTGSITFTGTDSWGNVNEGADWTLELNGYSLNGMVTVDSDSTLTVQDSVGGGKIGGDIVGIDNYGTVTVKGGTISGEEYGIYNNGEAIANVEGGEITSEAVADFVVSASIWNESGVVNVTGGKIAAGNADTAIYNESGTVAVSGGEVYGNGNDAGIVNDEDGTAVLSGGTFDKDYTTGYDNVTIADGYKSVDNGNGTWTVVEDPKNYVAQIGETKYETLTDAIAAVKNGEIITFLTDISEDVTIKQAANVSFTIDGARKTYTGTMTVNGTGYASDQSQGLTIQNVNFVVEDYGIYAYAKNNYARNVTVDGCSFTGTDGDNLDYGIALRHVYNITVKNTTGTNLFDLVYGGGSLTGFKAENIRVTNSKNGIWLSYVNSTATFKNLTMTGMLGSGIGIKNGASGTVTIEDCKIEAAVGPVAFEPYDNVKTKVTLVFKGMNTLTNDEGNWFSANLLDQLNSGSKLIVNLTEATYLNVNNISYGGLPYRAVLVDANVPHIYTFEKFVPTITLDDVKNQVSIKGACDHLDGSTTLENLGLETYGTLGEVTWNGTSYTCEITFNLKEALEWCIDNVENCTYDHTLRADSPETITYVATYDSAKSKWTITDGPCTIEFAGIKNVTYNFDCTDPTPAITLDDVKDLIFVQGQCVHVDGTSSSNSTYLTEEYATLGDVTWNGTAYTCTVTIARQDYLEKCIAEQTCECIHSVPAKYLGTAEYVVTYDSNANKWKSTAEVNGVKIVTYKFDCVQPVAEVVETGVKYGSLQEALNACTNGETVKLLVDITYTEDDVVSAHGGATGFGKYDAYNPSIIYTGGTKGATDAQNQPSNVNAVLDLNGHTITNNADAYLFMIMDNAKLTFKDSVGTGSITSTTETPVIWATGTETLVTIESGKYTTASATGLLWSTHGADMVITGGEFSTTADDASMLIVRNEKDLNNPNYFCDGNATITVKGGTFDYNPEKTSDDSINPFTKFNACAVGYYAIDNGNGTWTVSDDYVAWIKAELLAGRSVTLAKDITVTYDYVTTEPCTANGNGQYENWGVFTVIKGDVTFDLNGHEVTFEDHSADFCNKVAFALFFANNGADLTIVGDGDITVNGMATGAYSSGVGSELTIKGGNWVNNPCTECEATNIFLYASHGGELYIEDGKFDQNADPSYLIVEHIGNVSNMDALVDYSKTIVEVTGGHFVGMNPEQAHSCNQVTWSKQEWGTTNVVAEGYYALECEEHENCWTIGTAVAVNVNTGKGYGTADAALAAAKSGNTVKMLCDFEDADGLIIVNAGITFDLNGTYLTAKNFLSFGNVIDKAEEVGGLVISNNTAEAFTQLQPGNEYLPIYDTANGCYRFYEYSMGSLVAQAPGENQDQVRFRFRLKFNKAEAYNLLVTSEDSGVELYVVLDWTGLENEVRYKMSDEAVKGFAQAAYNQQSSTGKMTQVMYLTVSGLDKLQTGDYVNAMPTVVTDANVSMVSTTIPYTVK